MRTLFAGAFVIAAFAVPASALASERYFVVVDTVSNCSVIAGKVSTGKTAIGETAGYDSIESAQQALKKLGQDQAICKGIVG